MLLHCQCTIFRIFRSNHNLKKFRHTVTVVILRGVARGSWSVCDPDISIYKAGSGRQPYIYNDWHHIQMVVALPQNAFCVKESRKRPDDAYKRAFS